MKRRWALLLLCHLFACRRVAAPREDTGGPVQVLSVTPSYGADGKADFTVLMSVRNDRREPASATRVKWRMRLRRRWFAEGEQLVDRPLLPAAATRFELVLPLALRKPPTASDLTAAELSIEGELAVLIGGDEQTLSFAKTLVVDAPAGRAGPDED